MLKKSGGLSARLLKRKRTAKRIYPMGPSPVISFTNYNYRYATMFTVNPQISGIENASTFAH
jgi:hypothetical protein